MNEGIKAILALFVIVAGIGLFIKEDHRMPPNALVYIHVPSETYVSPPCLGFSDQISRDYVPKALKLVASEVKPDADCRAAGGFTQEGSSWTEIVLQRMGILETPPSRWNEDGTWNW